MCGSPKEKTSAPNAGEPSADIAEVIDKIMHTSRTDVLDADFVAAMTLLEEDTKLLPQTKPTAHTH